MSSPEGPKKSPKSPEREYQERARVYYSLQMGRDYDLFAAARRTLSYGNLFLLNESDEYLKVRQIGTGAAQKMLAEIESGLIRGFFTLEDLSITPAQFLALCQRYHYFPLYAFCAVPEFFGLENGIDEIHEVDDYPDYKLFLKARGSIDHQFRFFYDLTSFLVLPNGCRDSLGSSQVLAMCAPEDVLRQYAFRLQPIVYLKIQMGELPNSDEEIVN